MTKCSVEGCDNERYSSLNKCKYCDFHRKEIKDRQRRESKAQKRVKNPNRFHCRVEGCDRPTWSKGRNSRYCKEHKEIMRIKAQLRFRENRRNNKLDAIKKRVGILQSLVPQKMTAADLARKFCIKRDVTKSEPTKIPMPNRRTMRPDTFKILATIHGMYV